MKLLRYFLLMLCIGFGTWGNSQSVIDAIKAYAQQDQFEYNAHQIQENRILGIDHLFFLKSGDSMKRIVKDKMFFNLDGRPREFHSYDTWDSDSSITTYQYDSLNQLVKKEVLKPTKAWPPKYRKIREDEIMMWYYSGDTLVRRLHFISPTQHPYNGEQLVLFSCDSFQYNSDSSVTVLSNFKEHCKREANNFFEPMFRYTKTTQLFIEKGTVIRAVEVMNNRSRVINYGDCGYGNRVLPTVLSDLIEYSSCLPKSFDWLDRYEVDSVVNKEDTIEIVLKGFNGIIGMSGEEGSMFPDLDNSCWVRIYPKQKLFDIQVVSGSMHIFQAGNEYRHIRTVKHYNFDLQLLQTDEYSASFNDGWDYIYTDLTLELNSNVQAHRNVESCRKTNYSYYSNGLLKSIDHYNYLGEVGSREYFKLHQLEVPEYNYLPH